MDLRKRGRVPYGYMIIGGKAVIHPDEARRLKHFFRLFLEGKSLMLAAREAELPCSQKTFSQMIQRKEFVGTDYYPPLITKEYRQLLDDEWRRRREARSVRKKGGQRTVKIQTMFFIEPPEADAIKDDFVSDPAAYAAMIYDRIRDLEIV